MKFANAAGMTLLGMVLLTAGAGTASADTTTLICDLHNDLWIQNQPTTIDLNEAQGTVTIHTGGVHAEGGGFEGPVTFDPIAATFSDREITFRWGNASYPISVINRLTGGFAAFQPGLGSVNYACQAAHKQF